LNKNLRLKLHLNITSGLTNSLCW